jgi:hypothetical protein
MARFFLPMFEMPNGSEQIWSWFGIPAVLQRIGDLHMLGWRPGEIFENVSITASIRF